MAVKEFGIRDLRNHTGRVLDAVEQGDQVFLTRRGERIAEITSTTQSPVMALLAKAESIGAIDTGWADDLAADKLADIEAQVDQWD